MKNAQDIFFEADLEVFVNAYESLVRGKTTDGEEAFRQGEERVRWERRNR
jgi:hypothetical protein